LFYASLSRYIDNHGMFDAPIFLIIGLPLESLNGVGAKEHADKVKHWLKGQHTWLADGKPYQIIFEDIRVTSQPSGALFDYLLDDIGNFKPERAAHFMDSMAVLSVGFGTVELLANRNKTMVPKLTTGKMIGVRRLLELADPAAQYQMGELDSQLRTGALDVKPFIPIWEREVTGLIEKAWGQEWKRFTRIILVGGGAFLLGDQLQDRFAGKVFIPEDPILSTAHGLYKQAVQLVHRQAS
jgi:hypothetical protein